LTNVTIRTPRMLLRTLLPGDRVAYRRAHEASAAMWAPWFPVSPLEETADQWFDRQLERVASGAREGTECRLVGFLADGRIAGLFNLTQIFRRALQGALAGWSVNAEVARQGYATEGVIALLDLAFAPEPAGLGLHRVQANIIPSNVPSLRVAEKAGFRPEGLALRYLKIAGEWRDHAMHAKLADEHTPRYLPSREIA
jgi:[ribosomal protein S5]-alanine N-acetyltransferase